MRTVYYILCSTGRCICL